SPRQRRVRRRRDRHRHPGRPRGAQSEECRRREPVHQRGHRRRRCALPAGTRRGCTDRGGAARRVQGCPRLRGPRPRRPPLAPPPGGARAAAVCAARAPMSRNLRLLYGFSFFDPFMIVIPVWVPYLTTQGITMRQFMELQAVFAIVILCGEVPTGLLSDVWGRKKTLLVGSTLKAISFSLLPLWSSYEGFLFYHLTMGIALSMISGGDVALLYESHLAAGGETSRGTAVLGNQKLAGQTGAAVSALLGGAVVTLSYGHLLWTNAML